MSLSSALGAEAYRERIDQAENSFLFEVRMEEQQHDMHDPEGKTAFYNAVAKMLCGFTEKLERDNYIEAVAAKYMISPDDLRRLVNQQGLKAGLAGGGRAPQSVADAQDGARTEYKKECEKARGRHGAVAEASTDVADEQSGVVSKGAKDMLVQMILRTRSATVWQKNAV